MAQKSILPRMVRMFSMMAVLAILGAMLLACGEEEDLDNGNNTGSNGGSTPTVEPSASPTDEPASPTTNPDTIEHPTGRDEVIIKIEYTGGFVMPQTLMTRLPVFVLFGDGCYVVQGPQIEIYPAPALPNLQETCLSEEGVQEILAKAKDAGLLDGDAEYRNDMIADAATTVFTVNADGKTSVVSAYALEMELGEDPNISDEDREAREKLLTFMQDMSGVDFWIDPTMIVEEAHEYEIERMQIAVLPADSPSAPMIEEGLEPQVLEWPLDSDLANFGTPYLTGEFNCDVVEGEDLKTLLPKLQEANQLTHWVMASEGTPEAGENDEDAYILFLRPLFPGEDNCAEPISG